MPSLEFTVEPARLREAERHVTSLADRIDEHTSYARGNVPRALDDAARGPLDGTALADALTAAGVAAARAGDGLASALRAVSEGLATVAERYEAVDRAAARTISEHRR